MRPWDAETFPPLSERSIRRIVWNEAENFVYADQSPYIGIEAVLTGLFARLAGEWDGFSAVPARDCRRRRHRGGLGRYGGVYKATGAKVNAQFTHVFRFKDGRSPVSSNTPTRRSSRKRLATAPERSSQPTC